MDYELHLAGLEIEITRDCNLNCPHCMRYEPDEPMDAYRGTVIAPEVIDALFDRYRHIELLLLTGGEPMLHPEMITYIVDKIIEKQVYVEQIQVITKQIEKRIDVLQAHYFTDDEIFIQEVALYKLATPKVLENPDISKAVRQHGAQIVEVNPTYTVVSKKGMTDDIMSLYFALNEYKCVLQYVRSGRIAITKSCTEYLDEFLEERRRAYEELQNKE